MEVEQMAQQIDIVANLLMKVDGAEAGINKLKNSLSKLKMPEGLENSFKKSFSNLDTILARYKSQIEKGFQTKGDVSAFNKTNKELDAELNRISKYFTELTGKQIDFKVKSDSVLKAEKDLQSLIDKRDKLSKDTLQIKVDGGKGKSDIESLLTSFKEIAGTSTNAGKAANNILGALDRGDLTSALNGVKQLEQSYKRLGETKQKSFQDTTGLSMGTVVSALINQLTGVETKFKVVDGEIKVATEDLARFRADQINDATNQVDKLSSAFEKNKSVVNQASGAFQEYARSSQSMSQQLADLKTSTQYFFGLRNMINLFKRGVREAVNSVKELDKAMTETAVVTNFDVSDMWNMLPQYTQLANELGATTQGAYETMTLYFQQGLNQQQAFEIGAETMKMARIAGLDYAKTTDMMTAALRGFNMELNAASAQRINDVYSNLAAKTASNTEELGEAMERTASIAHSAGMSFEGTSAFLAQMIETTREAPENLGTAMKTIIARFQELKKNPLEMEEVDGEEVSFNKVDAALQTIGVSLKDTNGQFRELDKVFLDIAQRWDGLTQTQQRYIATTAAGSRQQSRFIAMMSNYARTTELMGYANDSAGASQEQFEKTMDSLESKLNQLHNAWQQFTMGIANNKMVKGFVDGLTDALGVVNKLINTLSFGSGTVKSFLSLFAAFTGLKMAGKMINSLIGGAAGLLDPTSSFGKGFFGGGILGKQNTNVQSQAQAIYGPIVAELRALRGQQQTLWSKQSGPYEQYKAFKTGRADLRELTGGQKQYNVQDVIGKLNKLTPENQMALMKTLPGTKRALQRSLINQYSNFGADDKQLKEIKNIERSMRAQVQRGQAPLAEYYKAMTDPKKLLAQIPKDSDSSVRQFLAGLNAQVNAEADKILTANALKAAEQEEGYGNLNKKQQGKINAKYIAQARQDAEKVEQARQQALVNKGYGNSENTKKDNRFDAANKAAAGIQGMGMAIMGFGTMLTQSLNPAIQGLGAAITSVGSMVMNAGMAFSGLIAATEAVTASTLMEAAAKKLSAASSLNIGPGLLTGILGAITAAVVAGVAIYKNHIKKIKEDAEKVTNDYKEKRERTQGNINNLESYREDFARLSAGVDKNGMNVNLDVSDYERYLEITDAIAKLNPSIVDGYNAQGHAIINNNKALEETLNLQKEQQATDFNDYISDDSTKKLQEVLDLSKRQKIIEIDSTGGFYEHGTGYGQQIKGEGREFKQQAQMRKEAQRVGSILKAGINSGWAKEDLLSGFNIDIEELAKGSDEAIKAFEQNIGPIKSQINAAMDAAGDDIKDKTKESMMDAFSGYSEAAESLDELITPMYEQLSAKMSQSPLVTHIPDEMKTYFNQGLKEIVSDANVEDIDGAAQDLAKQFTSLSEKGSDYTQIMDKVADAQQAYAATLDASAYDSFINGTDGAVEQMEALRDKMLEGVDTSQGYGKALSEFFENEINKIQRFTEEGAANLTHALNTMTEEVAAAEGKLESFNSIAEGSNYSTAASNMAKIYEEAMQDVHTAGEGDQTFWAGAEALVGRESLIGKSRKEAESLMTSVNEMLKGGEEGWNNFKNHYFDTVDAMGGKLKDANDNIIQGIEYDKATGAFTKLDENINPDVYKEVAQALHMSEESLIAMLNLGRQFGEIDFKDLDEARKAIATSDSVIAGRSVDSKGNRALYMKEETLNAELAQAGLSLKEQEDTKAQMQAEQNIKLIKEAGQTTIDEFKDMGIKSMDSLIDVFDSTGQFTKEEMSEYAKQWAELNNIDYNPAEFDEKFNQHLQEIQNPEGVKQTSQLADINSTTASILSVIASKRIEEGHLDAAQAENIKDSILGSKGADTMAQLFSLGKNEKGQALTETEYKANRDELIANQKALNDYLYKLQEGRDNASTEAEKNKFDEEIKSVTDSLGYLDKYINDGDAAWKTAQAQQNETNDAALSASMTTKLNDLVNRGFNGIFDSITPESLINNEANQQALNSIYQATLQGPAELTQSLMGDLQTLGIDIQSAIDAGLVIDSNNIYTKATGVSQEAVDAVVTGAEDSLNNTQIPEVDTSSAADKVQQGIKTVVDNINNIVVPTITPPKPGDSNFVGPTLPSQQETSSSVQAAQITVDNADANNKLQETQTTAEQVAQTISQGADFVINVPGADTLNKASNDAKNLAANAGEKTIGVKTGKVETSSLNFKPKTVTVPTKADNTAQKAINAIKGKSVTIKISPTFTGSWTKTATINVKTDGPSTGGFITNAGVLYRAKGGSVFYPKKGTDRIPAYLTAGEYVQNKNAVDYFGIDFMRKINHQDLMGALQSFGSAAKGRYGTIGPKDKGGLTLTGEKGFEIAWIPSESRSMILGANGPQMLNLPDEAVIYTHEQSKKILKQKSIPAGSHPTKSSMSRVQNASNSSNNSSSKKSSSKSKKKSSKKSKGSSDSVINNWSIEEVVRFDIDRKLETLASKIKEATDEIDKKLGRIGTKASHISAQTQAQVKNLQAVKANNEAIAASYQRDLNKLDTGGYNAKISYETGGSGKKKKNKTTEETINLSNYIYRDANGDYQIDKNAIANAGSKAKQEAIYKALEGALNPLVSGLQKAKDAAADAQKQMDELGKKISETFYQWENEITEVYDLTQRISHEESLRGRFSSQVALQLSKLNAGFGTAAQSIGLMQKALERDNKVLLEQIENQQKMIGARQRELKEALSAQDELDNLNRLRNKAYASTAAKTETINWATDQYTAARLGRNYLSNVRQDMDGSLRYEIDRARFNQDQKNDPYNKETYEAIKKYLDDLSSATDEFNNAIKDQTDLIKETYDALKEYQDYVGDYEDTLLKGLEEEIQNEVDNSKKLSDSITNALKDLLDEVKRKLDERRKQEDNRKTEDDIAKKQQRLAALRADTSGGHATEIAQLEKEIAESQQSYQRTLEDQLLDKLQQQGDEAAKQRERLIDLTEKQLEVSSSNNTALVDMWLRDPETYKEQIKNAWLEAQGYSEKGEAGQYILQQEFESGFANLVTAINQSGFASGFESISGDTSTLVGLLEMLTEGRDKLTDSLSKAAGALQDVEKRDTESFELGKRTQKTAAQWKAEGLEAGDLKKWNYTFKELKDSGFTNAELKNAGFTVKDFRENGINGVKDLRNAGFKAADLKPYYGLTRELYDSSTWEDLKAAKFSIEDYVKIGVKDAASLKQAGITLNQLKSNTTAWNSNSWAAIRKAGYTAADYKSADLSYANAIASGFTDQQLYSYYTEAKTKIDNANKAAANKTAYDNAITAAHKAGTVTKATLKDAIAKGAAYGVGKNAYQVASDLANGDGDGGVTWKEVMAQLKALGYSGKTVKSWNPNASKSSAFYKAFVNKYGKWKNYKTGGLADYTGPAWLDGTPSKPELILNAKDTKNFIMLKDVLSKAIDSSSGLSGFGGAAYEININVDHINSDYDVDKIAKRVKENIVKDSGYRNVTQVRKFR